MTRQTIYDIDIYAATKNELMREIDERLNQEESFTVMSVNPEILLMAEKTPILKKVLKQSAINLPDGIGTLLLAKKKGKQIQERIAGFDVFKELCSLAEKRNESIYLYGAEKWVVDKTAVELKTEFPNLKIAGQYNGYEKNKELVAQKIANSGATYLFVALGAPHQELFISQYGDRLNVKLIQPVGGSFDVVAGKAKRAPRWIQKINLEWLYRLLTDLKRIKRILSMLAFVAKELLKKEKKDE